MNQCLISKESIVYNITLPCEHSYEYIYLYYEILEQQKSHKGFKCPYCRKHYDANIPYYELDEVDKIVNMNYKQCKTLRLFKCSKCNLSGHKFNHGIFCIPHSKINTKPKCIGICKSGLTCKNAYVTDYSYCKKHNPLFV